MRLRDHLMRRAQAFCDAQKPPLSLAALGQIVMKDNKFFTSLCNGTRGFTDTTFDRFMEHFGPDPGNSPAEVRRRPCVASGKLAVFSPLGQADSVSERLRAGGSKPGDQGSEDEK